MPLLLYVPKKKSANTLQIYGLTYLALKPTGTTGQAHSSFVDTSGSNRTLTVVNKAAQGSFTPFSKVEGEWGVYFNGTADYVTTATSNTLTDFTYEGWFNVKKGASDAKLFGYGDANLASGFQVYVALSTGNIVLGANATNLTLTGGAFSYGVWHHVVVLRSSGTLYLYLDGVQQASASYATNFSGVPIIGANNYNGTKT